MDTFSIWPNGSKETVDYGIHTQADNSVVKHNVATLTLAYYSIAMTLMYGTSDIVLLWKRTCINFVRYV